MSSRSIAVVAAVAIISVLAWMVIVTEAMAQRGGGRGGGGARPGGGGARPGGGNINRNVNVNRSRVGVGAAAAVGAVAAGSAYYGSSECGYFPYPPCY